MTWISLADHRERRSSLKGLGVDRHDEPLLDAGQSTTLDTGSIVFETQIAPDDRPKVLFSYKAENGALRGLTFQAIPGGGVALVHEFGAATTHAALQPSGVGRTDTVRVTYSWSAPDNWARLAVERPGESTFASEFLDCPKAPLLSDLRDMMMGRGLQTFARDVVFAALSTKIEPLGPTPTLAPDTPIATPMGYKSVRNLKRGDTVYASNGDVMPVLHTLSRTVPARGSFAPVRLRAPYFGLQRDVIVAPDQRIVLDGSDVEYLFGEEAVLVPARHLVNGFAGAQASTGPVMPYTQIILPGHETVLAAGAPLNSLYVGRIRRKPDALAQSLLAGIDRNSLPEHGQEAHKVLKWFEAIQVATNRAA